MAFIYSTLLPLFLLGVMSSLSHCVGMCGGFVFCYSKSLPTGVTPHLLYNAGRLLTYVILGAVFAFLSQTTANFLGFVGFQSAIMGIAGIVMFVMALDLLGILKTRWSFLRPIEALFLRGTKAFLRKGTPSLFGMGMFLGLIPCGLVYSAGIKAAATGSVWQGALSMLAFGLGTVPALVALGWSSQRLQPHSRLWLQRISGVVLLFFAWQILHGATVGLLNSPEASHSNPHLHHHH